MRQVLRALATCRATACNLRDLLGDSALTVKSFINDCSGILILCSLQS